MVQRGGKGTMRLFVKGHLVQELFIQLRRRPHSVSPQVLERSFHENYNEMHFFTFFILLEKNKQINDLPSIFI